MSEVALRAGGNPTEPAVYGTTAYPHGPGFIVIVPAHVAVPLMHNGGYSRATPADLQAEIDALTARIEALRVHL